MSEPLSSSEAIEQIREIAKLGDVGTTEHCRQRMAGRGFGFQDLISVLLNGEVESQPEYDAKRGRYRYRVVGNTIDGDSAVAITVIVSIRSVLAVTIF